LPHARIGGEDQFAAAISLVQPLYAPFLKPKLDRARLMEERSQHAKRDQEVEIVAAVKQTYLRILVLDERLKLQHETLRRNKKVLADARSLYMQGRGLRVDTLRAYATVKNLQPGILKLTDAINTAKRELITLIGQEEVEEIELSDSLFIRTVGDIPAAEEVYEEAKQSRPGLQIFSLDEKIASEQVSSAKAERLPSLALVGQYQVLSQVNDMRLGSARWPSVSFAGLQLNVPLYSGNSNTAKIRDARLVEQQSALQHTEAQEQLKLEVRTVVASLRETVERLQTQTTVRETAKTSYDITQYRYQKGVASRLELTDAELSLTTAELNYLEAVYDYLSAHIQLDRVVGRKE
jgi:outer membrane protein TolC